MIFNTTTYILIAIIFILLCLLIYFILRFFKLNKAKNDIITEISFKFEITVKELESEIKRQNYVIADYHEKLFLKSNKTDENKPVIQSNTDNFQDKEDINNLIIEKNQLEKEKEQFKDKTKKLWEQSIAIHKEKERIESLKKRIEKTHQQVTDSIRYAKYIQTALLPPLSYLNEVLPEYFILFLPRDIVSGDFYWMKQIDNYVIILAADCTGHGVPGAFMSMLGISTLNEIISHTEKPNPAEILEELRKKVITSLHQEDTKLNSRDGMDAAVCVFNKETYELQFAGANNPMYHISENILTEYKATNCPVAYYIKMREFENNLVQIKKNDYIYIFSDGYNDQFGGKDAQKFKSKNLKSLLTQLSTNEMDMQQIKNNLEQKHIEWKNERFEQVDDIVVIGVKF